MWTAFGLRTKLSPTFIPAGPIRRCLMDPSSKSLNGDPSSASCPDYPPDWHARTTSFIPRPALRCVSFVICVVNQIADENFWVVGPRPQGGFRPHCLVSEMKISGCRYSHIAVFTPGRPVSSRIIQVPFEERSYGPLISPGDT